MKNNIKIKDADLVNQKVLDILILERKKAGYTLKDIADEMGLIKSSIYRFEQGDYNFTLAKFIEYCNILNISPSEVIKRAYL
jgi:transcriptional regulator with XRE-family HTH domain